jgi:hypothetical protein
MDLPYLDEFIKSDDGISCQVLDVLRVDFAQASCGYKKSETLVRPTQENEVIETINKDGLIETSYVAKAGDALFQNIHDKNDRYVPRNADGSAWKFDELARRNYKVVAQGENMDGVLVVNMEQSKVLHRAIDRPTCLKDAWGKEIHQFLFAESTLKLNNDGRITGIDSQAFKETWQVIPN